MHYKMRRPPYRQQNNHHRHRHHHQQQQQQQLQRQQQQHYKCYRTIIAEKLNCMNLLWLLSIVLITTKSGIATQDIIPHLCDAVNCPPLNEIQCPSDSEVREFDLVSESLTLSTNVTISVDDELYVPCCLAKKCICKTCYIPDCIKPDEVVVEVHPESMNIPGNCCGKHICQPEPNCTVLYNTENYWLKNCQRCKCYAGQRLCHQSCDEDLNRKSGICHSKSLNKFFEHGDTWKDGCLECECVNGEPNCVITFCRKADCPPDRQIKGRCCLKCYNNEDEDNIDDEEEEEQDEDDDSETGEGDDKILDDSEYDNHYDEDESNIPLEPLRAISNENNDPIPSIEWDKSSSSSNITFNSKDNEHIITENPCTNRNPCPSTYESVENGVSKSRELYPQVIELMRYNQHNDLLYVIIAVLSIIVVILAAWNIHLKAKQRSYRPVSHFDDNFNRMTLNIKKTNDYV